MKFWNAQAEQLEKKMLEHVPELMLHFLQTATHEQITNLVGEALPESDNTRSSIIAHCSARLAAEIKGEGSQAGTLVLTEPYTTVTREDGSAVLVMMPTEPQRSVMSMLAEGISPEMSAAINANCNHPIAGTCDE